MARINLKPRTQKAPVARLPKHFDERYIGPEPDWTIPRKYPEMHREICRGYYYYNYFYTTKEMRAHLLAYGVERLEWDAQKVKQFKSIDDLTIRLVDCSTARMLLRGLEFPDEEAWAGAYDRFINRVTGYFESTTETEEVENNKPTITIQQKMANKFSDLIAEIDGWYDNLLNGDLEKVDIVKWLRDRNVSQQHATQLATYYTDIFTELKDAKSKTAPMDLQEGYAHINKKDYQNRVTWYNALLDAFKVYGNVKSKTRKARKPKPISKEKLVSKLQYKKEDTDLNLVSSNPVDIVGAKAVWIYNTKNRKIGIFNADPICQVLGIKGTAIVGFDPKTSICKTLRKPKEQLAQFNSSGKIALRTYMDDIKATPTQLIGRINPDIIILKVVR
jgi:hypothetical protein